MLHMEIIQERLEREFDLDLVTTLPSVIYEVTKTDGTVVRVDNPHNYPDPGQIAEAREPYAKVSIISPPDYVGNIMPMCQERRGIFKDMQYLDTNLVELHYSMPLGEIIYDFFDALKARTKGYASLDYELEGYQPSELVKVDLLLNGDQVDALSFIAHRDKAYPRARRICEKLKENIPRQLFEVPIQAAIGGKIIARETVRPCARTCWPSATAATSPERRSCWRSRRKAKRKCGPWVRCSCPPKHLWPFSSWTRSKQGIFVCLPGAPQSGAAHSAVQAFLPKAKTLAEGEFTSPEH